jgi:hypothetical protein
MLISQALEIILGHAIMLHAGEEPACYREVRRI